LTFTPQFTAIIKTLLVLISAISKNIKTRKAEYPNVLVNYNRDFEILRIRSKVSINTLDKEMICQSQSLQQSGVFTTVYQNLFSLGVI
tara:strand:+ start:233 stop:496 length:264 start_codon:yes stop_codon:yes gene_type:complete